MEDSTGQQEAFPNSEDLLSQETLSNQKSASRISAAHSLPKKMKPYFAQTLRYRSVLVGEPAIFQCKLNAYPSPQITWFHNNRQIPRSLRIIIKTESNRDIHISSLEVKEVQERDSGSYKIFAINSEGSAESTASLLVAHGREQNAKYLEFLRKSEHTHEYIESMVQKRRGERLKVDLRCIGSPFDKKQETEQVLTALSPGKGRIRTISFENMPSLRQEFMYDKEQVRNQHSVRQECEKEALLDDEIKCKLQRLRKARKAKLEKRKTCLPQESAEVQVVSVKNVGFCDSKDLSHLVCRASEAETKGSLFQTIEQINETSVLPTVSHSEEIMGGSSSRCFEETSEFHTRIEQVLSLSGASQMPQRLGEKSNRDKMFEKQAFKGVIKQHIPEQVAIKNMRWENCTYAQEKSGQSRIDTKFHEHAVGFESTKAVEKNPSPLVYVPLADVSGTQKSEIVMYDKITLNVNEPTVASEKSKMSRNVEATEESLESQEDTKGDTETEELESPLPKYLESCPPFFIQEIESQKVNEGESCVFSCDFQGSPHIIVTWYNNDKPLPLGHECTINTTENHSTLVFSTVVHDQEGSIRCVIVNQHGIATTSGILEVKVKDKPELEPHNVPVCEIKLLSDYTEEEEELSMVFDHTKKDNEVLSTDRKATLSFPQQISFPKSCISDQDLLSLPVEIKVTAPTPTPEQDQEVKEVIQSIEFVPEEATEEQTSAAIKHKFKFSFDMVHESPKIIKEIQQYIRCREGDSVLLECSISGEPLPNVTWFWNDTVLTPTENFFLEDGNGIYKLRICKVSASNIGTYKCVAENKVGVVETACDLSVDPTVDILSSNTEQIDLKNLQRKVAQEQTEKETLADYFQSSAGQMQSSFSDKMYSESLQLYSVGILDFTEKEVSAPSRETESQLPNYLNDIMKSLSEESRNPDFQFQDQKGLSNVMESKVEEQKVEVQKEAIVSGPDCLLVSELRDTSAKQENIKVDDIHMYSTTKISSSQFGMVTESHTEMDTSFTLEGTSSHDLDLEIMHVKDNVSVFEETGKISKELNFTEPGSIIKQTESSIHSGEEQEETVEGESQEIAHEYLELDLNTCQYGHIHSSSDKEISSIDITEITFKDIKEQTCNLKQEPSAKESVDLSFPNLMFKVVRDDSDIPQEIQCFTGMLSEHSHDVSYKEEASVSHRSFSETENLDLELRKEETLQEVAKEQQDVLRIDKGLTYRSIISDKEEGILNHEQKICDFDWEKEGGIYSNEKLVGKEGEMPELVFHLKPILSFGDNVEKNFEEQIETLEPKVCSKIEHANKEQNKFKSKEVYAKEDFVSDITECNTNQIMDSIQKATSALDQDIFSDQPVFDSSGVTKQVQHAQENILSMKRKESGIFVNTETIAEKQEETIVKDTLNLEGVDTVKDNLIEYAEANITELYSSKDLYEEREQAEEVKFYLTELSPHAENVSQNMEDQFPKALCLGSEEEKLNSVIIQETSQKPTSFVEKRIKKIGKKDIKNEYWVTESVEAGITKSAQKSDSYFTKIVNSDRGFSDVNVPDKEGNNVQQPSLPDSNDRSDLETAYTYVETNDKLQESVEEMNLKKLYSASEDDIQNITENMDKTIHCSHADSSTLETIMGEKSFQECESQENGDIHLKLPFLNIENIGKQEEDKLWQEEMSLKLQSSASEGGENIQGEHLTSMQEISNGNQVLKEHNDQEDGTTAEEKELQMQEETFDLKAHAASLSEGFLLKESETLQKEDEQPLNLNFEIVSKESECLVKPLQSTSMLEEGISFSERLDHSYMKEVEGESYLELKLQKEEELSVAQLLKKALESTGISLEEDDPKKQQCEHEGKISEEKILTMSDQTFIWGPSENTPLSQYFQNVMKEKCIPESETVVAEADNFISDLKKAVHEEASQIVHKPEREDSNVKEIRSSLPERSNSDMHFQTEALPRERNSDVEESPDTSAKEPSLAEFLLSLKTESFASQEKERTDLKEDSVQCQPENEREMDVFVTPSIGNLTEDFISETTLQTQELNILLHKETDFSLTKYLLVAGQQEIPDVRDSFAKTPRHEESITSLEVEDVTFSTVYDYYKQQQEMTRPLSPESEMSIEIDSMNGDEMTEFEKFYTPPSSVENFESSYHTPTGSPERYSTPSENRYSTPSEERYSTPSEERYSTPSEERYSTPSEERNMARRSETSEGYQTPTGSLIHERSFSLEELRAEMFGTPCEALEPKGNEMPPAFFQPLTKRKVYENSTLRFIVQVRGTPAPNVKWYRNKSLLEQDSRLKIQKEGDICILEIHNIKKIEEGEYMCHAINITGEAKSIAQVEVLPHDGRGLALPPPVTHQHVIEFDVEPGSSSRTPSPQEILLEVELDEADIKECEKQVKIATLPELASDNQSMIVSLDVLPLSLVEHTMDLTGKEDKDVKIDFEVIEMPPCFSTPISDIEIPEKFEASFHCKVMGCPTPVVQWFKESKCISPDDLKYIVVSENGSHSLTIPNVELSDSGIYICKAVNTVGETICRCFLTVTGCQRFLAVADDGDGSLDCSNDRPQKIDLLVDNTVRQTEIELEFEFEQDTDASQKAVKLVAITDQEQEETGESCVNINFDVFAEPAREDKIEFKAENTESCSFEFQVTESPPKFVKNISDCALPVGTSASFQCQVVGSPKPALSWFRNGILIYGERYQMEYSQEGCHSLIIRNVVQNDEGEYRCVAKNEAGTAYSVAFLSIL